MYNKIFTKILDSSVWLEPTPTRIVWITLLAAMDEDGFCSFAAVGNIAGRARVTVEEAKIALEILAAPDPESSDPENEGRRLERVSGGWIVLNASKYRDIVSRANAQEKTRERVRRYREKNKGNADVTLGNGAKPAANAPVTPSEAVSDTKKLSAIAQCENIYKAYPKRKDKASALKAIAKALKTKSYDDILGAVQRYAEKVSRDKTDLQYVKFPATWFNAGSYDDDDLKPPPLFEYKEVTPEEWRGKDF